MSPPALDTAAVLEPSHVTQKYEDHSQPTEVPAAHQMNGSTIRRRPAVDDGVDADFGEIVSNPAEGPNDGVDDGKEEITVLVTGFGLFHDHQQNPSWLIARSLPSHILSTASGENVKRIKILYLNKPIRVSYANVTKLVPWLYTHSSQRIDFVIHIGLAASRSFYALETQAHRDGYHAYNDVDHKIVSSEGGMMKRWRESPPILTTTLDTADILSRWREALEPEKDEKVDVRLSHDAGHFLCDFLYFSSLAWWDSKAEEREGERRVVFFHVPNGTGEEEIARGRNVTVELIRACVESWLTGPRKGKEDAASPTTS